MLYSAYSIHNGKFVCKENMMTSRKLKYKTLMEYLMEKTFFSDIIMFMPCELEYYTSKHVCKLCIAEIYSLVLFKKAP